MKLLFLILVMLELRKLIFENFNLLEYNTFKVNVMAKYFIEINNEKDIKLAFDFIKSKKLKYYIIGEGSNILLTDNYEGLIIKNSMKGIAIKEENEEYIKIATKAGENWNDFVDYCVKSEYYGIENLSLIPGSVGAAPVQNIGAYGTEVRDVILSVNGYFLDSLKFFSFNNRECKFSYRNSIFKEKLKQDFLITSIEFGLSKIPKMNLSYGALKEELNLNKINNPTITEVSSLIKQIREKKLPNPKNIGNAGSFFKNPEILPEKYFDLKKTLNNITGYKLVNGKYKISAAFLIESAGFKSDSSNPFVSVYSNHSLVIINKGNANGKHIIEFANSIKQRILDLYDIHLEIEVNIVE